MAVDHDHDHHQPSSPTLTSLLRQAAASFPHRRAIFIATKWDLSHVRLQALVDQAALHLCSSAGISPGDVVALTFPNSVELVIMFLAVIRARAVAAPLNSAYTQEEFTFYLSDSDSKLLLTDPNGNAPAQAAAAHLGIPHLTASLTHPTSPIRISSGDVHVHHDHDHDHDRPMIEKQQQHQHQHQHHEHQHHEDINIVNDPSDVALFLHTSGTTSRPKGVPLTQHNLAASVRNIISVYRLSHADSTVVVLPLFHVHGLLAGLLSPLAAGGSVTLPAQGRFSASTFWADMRASNATWYTAVPTVHQILLDRHTANPEQDGAIPELRFIRSCSASLAPAILERLESAFKAPVLEAYAMTEASHLMTSNPLPEDGAHKAGSVGRAVGQEVGIVNEKGEVQEAGVAGEVCIRGANVTKGYKKNEEANKAAFEFGWFHTGDLGYVDEEGYLHLVGRIKELINRGGEKISPIEVDAVLLGHPDVAEAVAFGVPDPKYGEEINCAVIPRDGTAALTPADLTAFCMKNLASFKVPKRIFITHSLPKTATGKIQRRIVAQHFLDP